MSGEHASAGAEDVDCGRDPGRDGFIISAEDQRQSLEFERDVPMLAQGGQVIAPLLETGWAAVKWPAGGFKDYRYLWEPSCQMRGMG